MTRKPRRSVQASRAASLKGWRTRKAMQAANAVRDQALRDIAFRTVLKHLETTPRKPAAEALPNPWLEFNKATRRF